MRWIGVGLSLFFGWTSLSWGQGETLSPFQSIEYADIDLQKALPPRVVILLDSSGSMGQLMDKQKSKMFYAKKLFGTYLSDQWREKAEVGLLVYGGRRKKDCTDTFMAIPVGERSLSKIDLAVKRLSPTGMTPIAASLELAIAQLKNYPGPKRVMIFTDGEETCGGDSCKILEKAIQEKIYDLEMFVTGIGMKQNSKDLDKLRCLGKVFGAPDPKALENVLDQIDQQIKNKKNKPSSGPNLFVSAPDPAVAVQVFTLKPGTSEKTLVTSFSAREGAELPPGEYWVDVMLNPVFSFQKVVIPPKKKVTLKVTGAGVLEVVYFDGLLEVEVLNKDKKVIQSFLSDEKQIVPSGVYDIRIFGEPFFEFLSPKYLIVPNGQHEIKMDGIGVIQVDYPNTVGVHVYSGEQHLGNYLTNYPFILKTGTYRFYVNPECDIEGISIRNEKFLKRVSCPPKK